MLTGTGDEAFGFEFEVSVRLDENDCGVIDTPPPINFVFDCGGIGLNVILLLTPGTFGKPFTAEAATLRGVTVSSLFLVIAVTASLVASPVFDKFDWIGLRMMDGMG